MRRRARVAVWLVAMDTETDSGVAPRVQNRGSTLPTKAAQQAPATKATPLKRRTPKARKARKARRRATKLPPAGGLRRVRKCAETVLLATVCAHLGLPSDSAVAEGGGAPGGTREEARGARRRAAAACAREPLVRGTRGSCR